MELLSFNVRTKLNYLMYSFQENNRQLKNAILKRIETKQDSEKPYLYPGQSTMTGFDECVVNVDIKLTEYLLRIMIKLDSIGRLYG